MPHKPSARRYKGKMAGSIGHIGCLSFFPTKNLGAYGDAGMVLTNDPDIAEKISILRVHGSKPKYYHSLIGCNSRLDSIQASILIAKFKYLDKWNSERRRNADIYNELFKGIDVITPFTEDFNHHIYHQYVIKVKSGRDKLRDSLKDAGIATEIYYPVPLHLQKCFADLGYKSGDMPKSEEASEGTIALPIYPELTREQQEQVVKAIGFSLR